MHAPGDERNRSEGIGGPSSGSGGPEDSWFRFGDEPDSEDRSGASAAASPVAEPVRRPESGSASGQRHEPFVVSATPGGVDPTLMSAAESITFSVGRQSTGRGLMTAVLLLVFGVGGLAVWQGPRIAAAIGSKADAGWHQDLEAALSDAAASGRPVLVHFTADWCPPCRVMKEQVFDAASVRDRIAQDFVPVRIDLSDRTGPNNLLAQKFGITSIPAIKIYTAEGYEIGGFGFVQSPGQFNGELNRLLHR